MGLTRPNSRHVAQISKNVIYLHLSIAVQIAGVQNRFMDQRVITIRRARRADAEDIAGVHDAAWRGAYRGLIPGRELEQMISRRGASWWDAAIARGSRLLVLDFADAIGGYATYGRNRVPSLPHGGEVFELYLAPQYQGLGFGRRLFEAVRADLAAHGYPSLLVWALADNDRALGFYARLGGKQLRRAPERFGAETRERVAFGFD
jgi:ribosomal protein S18 acetylase RimI-like enzyme